MIPAAQRLTRVLLGSCIYSSYTKGMGVLWATPKIWPSHSSGSLSVTQVFYCVIILMMCDQSMSHCEFEGSSQSTGLEAKYG